MRQAWQISSLRSAKLAVLGGFEVDLGGEEAVS